MEVSVVSFGREEGFVMPQASETAVLCRMCNVIPRPAFNIAD